MNPNYETQIEQARREQIAHPETLEFFQDFFHTEALEEGYAWTPGTALLDHASELKASAHKQPGWRGIDPAPILQSATSNVMWNLAYHGCAEAFQALAAEGCEFDFLMIEGDEGNGIKANLLGVAVQGFGDMRGLCGDVPDLLERYGAICLEIVETAGNVALGLIGPMSWPLLRYLLEGHGLVIEVAGSVDAALLEGQEPYCNALGGGAWISHADYLRAVRG